MARVSIRSLDEALVAEPPPGTAGVETRVYFARARDPIHLRLHRLAPGARLQLSAGYTDLSVYIWKGTVEAGATRLEARSSAIVEGGAALTVVAGKEGASLLAFHLGEGEGDGRSAGRVHLLPHERVPRTAAMGGNEGIGGALHADAHLPTPQVWLHENDYAMADKETAVHSHSEDEVIFVRAGSVRLGNRLYGPGTALAIAANTKYGFFSGPDGLSFVNFRGSSPTYTSADGALVMDEAELWRKAVGLPSYIELTAD